VKKESNPPPNYRKPPPPPPPPSCRTDPPLLGDPSGITAFIATLVVFPLLAGDRADLRHRLDWCMERERADIRCRWVAGYGRWRRCAQEARAAPVTVRRPASNYR